MSSVNTAIEVTGLHKYFKPTTTRGSFKEVFTKGLSSSSSKPRQHVLNNISFTIRKGEFVGIVGKNGSGKSTLLKILAEIYAPTSGDVKVRGKLVPFIELGVGFSPDLTGKENVYLNGAILGFSTKEMDMLYDEIVDFAELKEHMDKQLKNYSSGMQVRLAFSIAIRAKADILLIDEVLAVGDSAFQRKCFDYFKQIKGGDQTVVFVTHDMESVRQYCDRAILIDKSKIVKDGDTESVTTLYNMLNQRTSISKQKESEAGESRWGDKFVRINKVSSMKQVYQEQDKNVEIRLNVLIEKDAEDVVFGIRINNQQGQQLSGTNTKLLQKKYRKLTKGTKLAVSWKILNVFNEGEYLVTLSASHENGVVVSDWWPDAIRFGVSRDYVTGFLFSPPISIKSEEE